MEVPAKPVSSAGVRGHPTRTVRVGRVTVWGRMVRRTLFVLGVVIGGIFVFAGLVFVAMRTKSQQLLDAVRWFNRTFTNRLQRPFAGKPGAYASVIPVSYTHLTLPTILLV